VPAVPVSQMDLIWEQFAVLLPDHPNVDSTHPLCCYPRRVPNRVVFEHLVGPCWCMDRATSRSPHRAVRSA